MDGVGSVGRGLVFHGNASGNRTVGTFHIGKHFCQDGIVKDRSVEQLFFMDSVKSSYDLAFHLLLLKNSLNAESLAANTVFEPVLT